MTDWTGKWKNIPDMDTEQKSMVSDKDDHCVVCLKPFAEGQGCYNYPDGLYCADCGKKSKWYEKFSRMTASQIIKYMGIDPKLYGLTDNAINYMSRDNRSGDE